MDQWAWENGVQLDFTRPGKPTDNGLCESFNGRLRDVYLNVHEFESVKHVCDSGLRLGGSITTKAGHMGRSVI